MEETQFTLEKNFVFSPFMDLPYFTNILKTTKYHLIDFSKLKKSIKCDNQEVFEFLFEKEMTVLLKPVISNKKFKYLVFITGLLDPEYCRKYITNLVNTLNPSLKINFELVTSKVDLEDFEYDIKSYENIHIFDIIEQEIE